MTPLDNDSVLVKKIIDTFRHDVISTTVFKGEVTHLVELKALRSVCSFIKTDPDLRMNYLVDIAGVDYPAASPRFEVVYHFYSIPRKHRLRLKVKVGEGESVPSIAHIWRGADWPEREAYDMYGITFEGHPDLRRIYLAEDWEGFPLRKDYPLRGYKDRYNPFGEDKE